MNGETRWKRRQGETRELRCGPQEAKGLEDPTLPSPALGFLPPATMASRSPSRFGRIRMNSCRRNGATSVLLFTNIRTGFFKDTEARSLTSSVIVAEKSIVWRWWEHIRMISFICSSKYSSSILASREGKESREKPTLTSVTVKGRKYQTGKGLMLSQVRFQAHLLTYFISINIVILPFQQDSLRVIIWPHSLHPFFFG